MAWVVNVTARAALDFLSIFEEIGAVESAAAHKWYEGLKRAILSLEELPHRCPIIRRAGAIRQLPYGHKPDVYLVLYRVRERQKRVDVLHIRHGSRRRFTASDLQ